MGLMWFCLGSLSTLALWGLVTWNGRQERKFSPLSWIMFLVTLLAFLFTSAWTVSSMVEHEPQAAGMGLLVFGFITLVLAAITGRLLKRNAQRPSDLQ